MKKSYAENCKKLKEENENLKKRNETITEELSELKQNKEWVDKQLENQ